ncbi:MAG: hypothetical protein COW65_12995 [Cytophagales bacterium CG18_big_fil_WC_8_21_14_2_50_42_9]|nr:MAG: hypothetical protein COW65_12995 [Cytophagales bacterium CG18_big_fil_WC_8_21_14_2_50_42_9]
MWNIKIFRISVALQIVLAISLIVYLCSLFKSGITYLDVTREGSFYGSYTSLELLLYGGIGILGGGLLEGVIRLANPFYYYSIYLLILGKNEAIKFLVFSCLLALSFRAWNEILVPESGRNAEIISFQLGYYLWLGSFIILLLGILVKPRK